MPLIPPALDQKPQTTIEPVDTFIQAGLCQNMTQQFRVPAIFVTSPDALAQQKAQLGNKQPEYPYLFMYIQSFGPNTDSYMTNRLARHGIPVQVNNDNKQIQVAKLIPTNFETEVTYVTNKYDGLDTDSVKGFVRRWLTTRRNGALNFQTKYGLTSLAISCTMADVLQIPKRDNPADAESMYSVVTNVTVHGFVSEPALGTRGRIQQIVLSDAPPNTPGQFFPF